MKRTLLRGVARSLVGLIVLAQLTISAYACPGVSSALLRAAQPPAAATVQTEAGGALRVDAEANAEPNAEASPMPDCSGMTGAMDDDSANLCAEHCKFGQQGDHPPALTVPPALLNALYATPPVPERPIWRDAARPTCVPVAAAPPHSIQHCVFRL